MVPKASVTLLCLCSIFGKKGGCVFGGRSVEECMHVDVWLGSVCRERCVCMQNVVLFGFKPLPKNKQITNLKP